MIFIVRKHPFQEISFTGTILGRKFPLQGTFLSRNFPLQEPSFPGTFLYRNHPFQELSFTGTILYRNFPFQEPSLRGICLFRKHPIQELSFSGTVFHTNFMFHEIYVASCHIIVFPSISVRTKELFSTFIAAQSSQPLWAADVPAPGSPPLAVSSSFI